MARSNDGLAETTLHIAAKLPWWVDVALAIALYFLLHAYASHETAAAPGLKEIGPWSISHLWKSFALFLQYLLPALFLIGAALSVIARKRRLRLFANATQSASSNDATDITWQQFEQLIGEAFRQQGYAVKAGDNDGIELILSKKGQTFLVLCKQWRATQVGISTVQQLQRIMAAQGAAGGYVVTMGRYTRDAKTFAADWNIGLIDSDELQPYLQRARRAKQEAAWATVAVAHEAKNPDTPLTCPKCGSAMVKRAAKRGATTGATFWGCVKFPACNGTRAA